MLQTSRNNNYKLIRIWEDEIDFVWRIVQL